MDNIKAQLISLFDEMLNKVEKFNKASYNNIFLEAFKKYEDLVNEIAIKLEDSPREIRASIIEEIAAILPDYAETILDKYSEKEKRNIAMNLNMNMVIYVLPVLTYSHENYCEKTAKKMVELWNAKNMTNLKLQYSTYESIAGGFKKKLCYITTAVCEYQNKPDDCYELTTLRNYRDNYLMQTEFGQDVVEEYYNIAPGLVMMINMQENKEDIYQHIYETYLSPCINYIEENKNQECCDLYMQMVCSLQKKYLYS